MVWNEFFSFEVRMGLEFNNAAVLPLMAILPLPVNLESTNLLLARAFFSSLPASLSARLT